MGSLVLVADAHDALSSRNLRLTNCAINRSWSLHTFPLLLCHFSFTLTHHDHSSQRRHQSDSMSTNSWPRSNMPPTTDKQGSVSAKPLFLRSRIPRAPVSARTPVDRQPIVPPQITKPRKSRHSDRRDSNRVQKNREIEKPQDPRAALADKFAGESLTEHNAGC